MELQSFDHLRSSGHSESKGYSSCDRDRDELYRLGKRQVLKVLMIHRISLHSCLCSLLLAKFWVHVHAGLQLYHARYMGDHIDVHVCINNSGSHR